MGPEFWQTPMGKRYYEHTLPELVRQLGRLADLGERVLPVVEAIVRLIQARVSTPSDPSSPAPGASRPVG